MILSESELMRLSYKITNPDELSKWMSTNIQYGFTDKHGTIYTEDTDYDDFDSKYRLQSPKQMLASKVGVCWDQVEFERHFFTRLGIPYKTFYVEQINRMSVTHTFLVYTEGRKLVWFENSFEICRGMNGPYDSINDIIDDVHRQMLKKNSDSGFSAYFMEKPRYGIDCQTFMKHAISGRRIN